MKKKYINILDNKIYQEYYSKDNFGKKINTIYTNGFNF